MFRKITSLFLILLLALGGLTFAEETATRRDVVILYTNDVHCGIDDAIGYAGLAAYKKAYEKAGYAVALVDSGDAIQGAAVGTLSKGEYLIDIMNEVGYDVATIGNHEFDYSMTRFNELRERADFTYVAANFMNAEGEPVLEPYVIRELGGYRIAFVGAATPETLSNTAPIYFRDADGNYIYSFCEGNDGADLYAAVQKAVDDARAEGADAVIVLSHLGTAAISHPWTSTDLIANTNGIDAVLDGHSHSVWAGEREQNKDGEPVLMSSTGTKLNLVGSLTITTDADGKLQFATALHDERIFRDEETASYIQGVVAQYKETLDTVVAHTDVDLTTTDPVAVNEYGAPLRIIRSQETNLGDLCTDGFRAFSGADVAFINGGGIRETIPAGDITYGKIIAVHPYDNNVCVVEATGAQILDALEYSVHGLPGEGSFLQVSGLTFEARVDIPTSVKVDEKGMFAGVEGERRVQNAKIGGEPIDPEKTYTVASIDYILKNCGGGYNMFADDPVVRDNIMLDNEMLIRYITEVLGGVVGEEYADPYGQGRIVILGD